MCMLTLVEVAPRVDAVAAAERNEQDAQSAKVVSQPVRRSANGLRSRRQRLGVVSRARRPGWRLSPRVLLVCGFLVALSVAAARLATENAERFAHIALILVAGTSVAVADSLIKKAAHADDFWGALRSPVTVVAVALYLLQILLFTYVFVKKWNLGVVGIMQMVIYAAIVVFVGITFFQERITRTQGAGMALALIGAVLMNL